MPFYRCTIPSSGGGSGGDVDELYGYAISNGEKVYPTFMGSNAYTSASILSEVKIGNKITNGEYMFRYSGVNCPVTLPASLNSVVGCFMYARSLNSPVTIENGITRVDNMFYGATLFNQPLTLPDSVTSATYFLFNTPAFNSKVVIGNNVTNCRSFFQNSRLYNKPIIIPENVQYTHSMFYNADSFNSPVVIQPNNNIGVLFMFNNCPNYGQNVIFTAQDIGGPNNIWYRGMFLNHNNQVRVNIYTYNPSVFTKTEVGNTLTNYALTWAATTNGYYNAYWNIYILNNVQAAYDAFNTLYAQI